MSRESILIILGVLIAVSPWCGLPLAVLTWILLVLGLAIAFVGFTLRARAKAMRESLASLGSHVADPSSRP